MDKTNKIILNFVFSDWPERKKLVGTYLMDIWEALVEVKANFKIIYRELNFVLKLRALKGVSKQLMTYAKGDARDGLKAARKIEGILDEGFSYFL